MRVQSRSLLLASILTQVLTRKCVLLNLNSLAVVLDELDCFQAFGLLSIGNVSQKYPDELDRRGTSHGVTSGEERAADLNAFAERCHVVFVENERYAVMSGQFTQFMLVVHAHGFVVLVHFVRRQFDIDEARRGQLEGGVDCDMARVFAQVHVRLFDDENARRRPVVEIEAVGIVEHMFTVRVRVIVGLVRRFVVPAYAFEMYLMGCLTEMIDECVGFVDNSEIGEIANKREGQCRS